MARISNYGSDAPQSDSAVSAIRNNPGVAAQPAAIDPLQRSKNVVKRYIDQMGQLSTETPGGIFGRLWPYGGKVLTDQQLADAKSAVDRAQNDDEVYQAIRNLDYASHQDDVGTGMVGRFVRGMNNTPIPSIGNNSFLGNNRTPYELPGDDSSWAYNVGKYGGGLLELGSDLSGVGDTLKMAKAARFNPFTFAGMLYRDAKQTGKDIVNLPRNIVNGIRNAGSKTSNFVKDSVKAGTEGKSLKAYNAERTATPAGETAQTGGRAAETAAPAAERTAAPAPRQEPAPQQPAPAPRQEPAPQQPAPAPRQEPAPAAERTAASETAADDGVSELANAGNAGRGTAATGGQAAGREAAAAGEAAAGREAATAGEQAAGREAAAGEAATDGGVSELANAGNAGRETAAGAATGSVSEGVDSASQLIEHIRSGTLDEMERAWIESMAAGAAKAPGTVDAATQAILNEARAAGILGREAAAAGREAAAAGDAAAGTGSGSAAGNVGREAAAGEQAASREAIVAARDAAVAKLDPQLQAALANVRESLANHNISPRQVLHELGSPRASDKDFYEIGRIFFEVGRKTHGAGLSPAEQAVADAYVKSYEARMTQGFTRAGRGLTHFIDANASRAMIDSIKKNGTVIKKDGTVDANGLEYIRGLARNSDLTPESQALVDAARSAGLIP